MVINDGCLCQRNQHLRKVYVILLESSDVPLAAIQCSLGTKISIFVKRKTCERWLTFKYLYQHVSLGKYCLQFPRCLKYCKAPPPLFNHIHFFLKNLNLHLVMLTNENLNTYFDVCRLINCMCCGLVEINRSLRCSYLKH